MFLSPSLLPLLLYDISGGFSDPFPTVENKLQLCLRVGGTREELNIKMDDVRKMWGRTGS